MRHAAIHHYLPDVPAEILQHLLFFGCKFFRDVIKAKFPTHAKDLEQNFLSMSFANLTTYADKVQKLVSKAKKSKENRRIAWLLERGVVFDGNSYISEKQFIAKYKDKYKIMPHLGIKDFIAEGEMVRIVPVQAPKSFTADITLRKGSVKDSSLPVVFKKTDLEEDYPFLTKEIGQKLGKSTNFIAKTISVLELKGDPKYHQEVRSSKSGSIHRYSHAAIEKIKSKLQDEPNFNPYAYAKVS
jgi:hypothetical protein